MNTYTVLVDNGYRFEYHSTIQAESVKQARAEFMKMYVGTSTLWNGEKSFKVSKITEEKQS